MKLTTWFAAAAGLLPTTTASNAADTADTPPRRIAVIGAGAAGASTAYHLRQFADQDGVAVNITLFEKTDRIGGRALVAHAFDDPNQPVELGASIFVEVDAILQGAAADFSLPRIPAGGGGNDDGSDSGGSGTGSGMLGIWDGDRFVYTQDDRAYGWWNLVRLVWTYGTAPYRADKLMQATVRQFLALYEPPYFPFRSLTTRAYELELAYVTSQTGAQFLRANGVSDLYAHDIVQASTRASYASNLARLHGLETMMALAPAGGASQIRGGNWQLFDRMVRASGAAVRRNTSVTAIGLVPGSAPPHSKYIVKTTTTATTTTTQAVDGAGRSTSSDDAAEYDDIVIATPYQFSSIAAGDGVLQTAIDAIPYVALHVTLFASPLRLSPAFFGLEPAAAVPTTVLTTLAEDDDDDDQGASGPDGAGKPGFFSIRTLRRAVNPATLREEYLYKIVSPEKVTAAFLSELFDIDIPDSITGEPLASSSSSSSPSSSVPPISWYYPHVFHAYPKGYPRVTFQDPIVGDGVYYTSGMESFISTMETSALMGKNVARLIVDDIQGLSTGETVAQGPGEQAKKMTKGGKTVAGLQPDKGQQAVGEL
ncbi:prenylcysteine oxidase [Sporothrix brasiliensis 5110]|uniref:Prenylcysteine oxidase n=1 Tax=Sporothrix brasiliensis 5110 TaxID=1398154 RepID=A0A0C2FSE0_9PEZI|nr:prenylcysteine oxidase [Sporothrix brasiliensis 5110]KIH93943.1 prenylcysteine oxidase [Sporothrix brasiliensis 5110]